jgi:translation initiation factor 1A
MQKPKYKDKNKKNKGYTPTEHVGPIRVPLPKEMQALGIIEQRLGGNKMQVACLDGKSRMCRVPGRLKRKLWLRPDDVVMIDIWELDDKKGDVILKYRPNQIDWLKKNGHLTKESEGF